MTSQYHQIISELTYLLSKRYRFVSTKHNIIFTEYKNYIGIDLILN